MLAMMLVIDAIVPQPALTLQSATGAPSEAPSCEHWQSWGAAVDCQDGAVAYLPAAEDERPAPAASD